MPREWDNQSPMYKGYNLSWTKPFDRM